MKAFLKTTFWFFFDLVLCLELKIHEHLLRCVRHHQGPLSKRVLKTFLTVDHRTRNKIIANFGIPLFKGLHPKNVFNFRYQFFLDHIKAEDVVLDVACGNGLLLHRISTHIKSGIGLERDETQLAICRSVHTAPNLRYIAGDIFHFDYSGLIRNEHVSVAIFSHILEHIDDVPGFLKMVAAPAVLICVPSQENWLTQLKINLGLPYLTDSTHFREYTRTELVQHLEAAGYAAEQIGFNSEGEIVCHARLRQ